MAVYVDDNLVVDHPEAIEDIIEQLKKNGFVVKMNNNLKDYLSCEIQINSKEQRHG